MNPLQFLSQEVTFNIIQLVVINSRRCFMHTAFYIKTQEGERGWDKEFVMQKSY